MRIPLITVHEWRSIAPLLPPTNDPGKARHGDRLYVSAFYYAEAVNLGTSACGRREFACLAESMARYFACSRQ